MLNIEVQTIAHNAQRYDTVGDYVTNGGKDIFYISDLGDRRYEWLIAIHELVEKVINESRGISNGAVDAYDFARIGKGCEPGDESVCPYRDSHCIATAVERLLCGVMGLSWSEYEAAIG